MFPLKDKIFYTIGVFGESIGLCLILIVSVFDFFMTGVRGILHYSIEWRGILLIWLGLGLIVASKHLDKSEW